MPSLMPPRPGGQWRVNIDVRRGCVTARPETSLIDLLDRLVPKGVSIAVIDLDRSIGSTDSTELLEGVVRRHPGRIWVGGRLDPASPHTRSLLDAGAAGVIISSSALFTRTGSDSRGLDALAGFREPSRLMISIDIFDGHLAVHGFTRVTDVTASDALNTVSQAASGRIPVLYTDVAAAVRRRPPDWRVLREVTEHHLETVLWYAGGIASWAMAERGWSLGLGIVTGRAYLSGDLGLTLGH